MDATGDGHLCIRILKPDFRHGLVILPGETVGDYCPIIPGELKLNRFRIPACGELPLYSLSVTLMSHSTPLQVFGKAVGLAAVSILAAAPMANAFTHYGALTGQEFHELEQSGKVEVAMSPESRFGDGGLTARTHEVNIHNSTNTATFDESNYVWENGTPVDFSVVFDGLNTLTYTVGDTVLVMDEVERDFSDLYLRAAARSDDTSMTLTNLIFSSGGVSEAIDDVAAVCESECGFFDASYYHIGDIDGAFTLTGQSIMEWIVDPEARPDRPEHRDSRLAYQVKLVYGDDSTSVPEPGMLLGLAGLVAGAIATGQGKQKKDNV